MTFVHGNPEITDHSLTARAGLPWSVTALGFYPQRPVPPTQTIKCAGKGGLVIDHSDTGSVINNYNFE